MLLTTARNSLRYARPALAAAALAALSGCHPDMWDQPRYEPYEPNAFYKNGMAMRQPIEGTVTYGDKRRMWTSTVYETISGGETQVPGVEDVAFYTGKADGEELATNYFDVSMELLQRGKERYEITCAPCHGYTGEGDGVITQRGFPRPTTYHIDRLREANDGYFFDVITNGYGRMYSYAARVAPEDRWAIAAYIRALQHSQTLDLSDPDSDVAKRHQLALAEQKAAEAKAHDDHHGDHGGADHDTHSEDASHDGGEAATDAEHDADAH